MGPDFICFGAQKAGTRWLYDQLQFHPDFWMPPVKEMHYFDKPKRRRRPSVETRRSAATNDLAALNRKRAADLRRPLDERDLAYLDQFAAMVGGIDFASYAGLFKFRDGRLSGDITPAYSKLDDDMVGQIAMHFPDAKYLFVAREPISRFWSQVRMDKFVKERIAGKIDTQKIRTLLSHPDYDERSYASRIVARWRCFVSPDRLRVFFFDDLLSDPAAHRARILSFLGADADKPSGALHPGFDRKQDRIPNIEMTDDVRAILIEHFEDELRACAREFGGPAELWPQRYGL